MTTLFVTIGDSFDRLAEVKYENGAPYPLEGCALWFTVVPRYGDDDDAAPIRNYWVDGGGAAGIEVPIAELGGVVVSIPPEQTAELQQHAYRWDLQLDDAWGRITTIDKGVLVARPSPTLRTTTP